jgi:hypothetical protein
VNRPNIGLGQSGVFPHANFAFVRPSSSFRICCRRISRYRWACFSKAEWRCLLRSFSLAARSSARSSLPRNTAAATGNGRLADPHFAANLRHPRSCFYPQHDNGAPLHRAHALQCSNDRRSYRLRRARSASCPQPSLVQSDPRATRCFKVWTSTISITLGRSPHSGLEH